MCRLTYKTFSFAAEMDDGDVTDEEDYEYDNGVHGRNNSHGYQRLSDWSIGNHIRSSSSVYEPPLHYYNSACDLQHTSKVQAKESVSSHLLCLFIYQVR